MGDYKKYLEEDYDGDEQERKRQKMKITKMPKKQNRKLKISSKEFWRSQIIKI